MKRTISLIILLAVASVLVAQPVSKSGKEKSEKATKMYVVLGKNIRDGKFTKEEILSDPVLHIKKAGSKKDAQWSVTSFKVIIVQNGMEEPPFVCQGNRMSEKAIKYIENATPRTVVYFADIRVSSKEDSRLLDDFAIRIK